MAARAEVVARYADGPAASAPAVTRRGDAWYVGTRLDDPSLARLLRGVLAAAEVAPPAAGLPAGIEAVRRRHADGRTYLFLLNHTDADAEVAGADRGGLTGTDLLTGTAFAGVVPVPAGGVVVLAEEVA